MRWILLLVPFALTAQLTTGSYWQWRTPSAPAITPGGGAIVYSLAWNDPKTDTAYANLWMVSIHGENRPLTTGDYSDTSPRVSPDGTRVAFLSNRSGSRQIHVRWLDGRNEAQVTRAETAPGADFSWSPDSAWIAYAARVPAAEPGFKVNLPKPPAGARWGTPASVVTKLRWRADKTPGQGIVPEGETHLFVIPAEGGAARQVTRPGLSVSGGPDWSPDGRTLVASARLEPAADRQLYSEDIYAISFATGEARRLSTLSGNESAPAVSPDGTQVAFLGFVDKGNANHTSHLYTVPLAGGAAKAQATTLDRNIANPIWRADSRAVFGLAESEGVSHVYQFDLDGGSRALTAGNVRFSSAYAAAEGFTMSRDGRFAITRSSYWEPKEIVTFTAAEPAKVTRLTHSNDALLADKPLGKVEELRYASFDGKQIQGWLIHPPGFDAAKKYPLILDIHGGPHAMYGVEFNWQMQVYAARGFVVLYTNPRGSTGYGEEFGNVIHARYPG